MASLRYGAACTVKPGSASKTGGWYASKTGGKQDRTPSWSLVGPLARPLTLVLAPRRRAGALCSIARTRWSGAAGLRRPARGKCGE